MYDVARQKLCELIATYGRSLCDDPRRCEGLLRDLCGEHRREVQVLVSALKERVAAELLGSHGGFPEVLVARLTKRLQDNLGLTEDAARWAVEAWALALGVSASTQQESPEKKKASPPGVAGQRRRWLYAVGTLVAMAVLGGLGFVGYQFFFEEQLSYERSLAKRTPEERFLLRAQNGETDEVRSLLATGMNPNTRSDSGWTALILAAGLGHLDTVKVLIASGAQVNAQDGSGWTALMRAADRGNTDTVKALIANGAQVNVKNTNGATALMVAKERGHAEIARILQEAGANQ